MDIGRNSGRTVIRRHKSIEFVGRLVCIDEYPLSSFKVGNQGLILELKGSGKNSAVV